MTLNPWAPRTPGELPRRRHRVRLAAGWGDDGLEWDLATHGRPEDPNPWAPHGSTLTETGLPLDGLTYTRLLPTGQPWPCQPDPSTLTFAVSGPTAATLAAVLTVGAPVAMVVYAATADDGWEVADTWTGYAAAVSVAAHDGHSTATVSCVDWTQALAEVQLDDELWPIEAAQSRIGRVMNALEDVAPELAAVWDYAAVDFWTGGPGPSGYPPPGTHVALAAVRTGGRTALDVLREALTAWTIQLPFGYDYAGQLARYALYAHHTALAGVLAGTDPLTVLLTTPDRWLARPHLSKSNAIPPGTFGETGAGWGVVLDDYEAGGYLLPGLIPARHVDLSARWSQRIGETPTTAVVTAPFTTDSSTYRIRWTPGNPRPRVKIKVETVIEFGVIGDATYESGAMAMYWLAWLLVPDVPDVASYWGCDAFTWHPALSPAGARWLPGLGEPVTVSGVLPDRHPNGARWVTGQLDHYTVTFRDGLPVVTFGLRPRLRDPVGPHPLTYAEVPEAVTYDDLDPATTYADLRLVRGP